MTSDDESAVPHHQRVRAQTMRLLHVWRRNAPGGRRHAQVWVPDVNAPGFAAEAHRQSLTAANSPTEVEDQAFVDDLTEWDDR